MSRHSRRELLQGLGGLGVAIVASPRLRAAQPGGAARFAYVGGFNDPQRKEHGEGISVFRIDASGQWTLVHVLRDVVNPGYLILDRAQRVLYAVQQRTESVSAFAIDASSGVPTLINTEATGGLNPAHLSLDGSGRFLVVANYGGGTIAVLPVRPDGGLGPRSDLVTLSGPLGPHRTEQASSHPHHCPFDPTGRFVAVPDKGLDRVFVYRFDATTGRLVPAATPFVSTRAGAGPRHIAFHRTAGCAYVINELDSTVTTCRWNGDGTLQAVQVVPSTPTSFVGDNTGSEVVISRGGRLLFASNRGHDSVGVFAIDAADGLLAPLGWEPTAGATPRFIGLSPYGTRLFAANQNGDTIVSWDVDEPRQRLTRTPAVVKVGCPTVIAWSDRRSHT